MRKFSTRSVEAAAKILQREGTGFSTEVAAMLRFLLDAQVVHKQQNKLMRAILANSEKRLEAVKKALND